MSKTSSLSSTAFTDIENTLYLVDGSGFIFRAFYALPHLTRSDGTPIGAVLGFVNMLIRLVETKKPKHFAVIFDAARATFRTDLYPAYKANRVTPPEELVPQFSLIREACKAFNVPVVEMMGYEADDLIATYTKLALQTGKQVSIVSSDKDLMQLVNDNVQMFDPLKNLIIGDREVEEKFGVTPSKIIDLLALAGDTSDNVPGIPGIGPKTAALLLNEYGSLEALLNAADSIKQTKRREALLENASLARLSKELVTLKEDVEVPLPLRDLKLTDPHPEILKEFLVRHEFKSLQKKYFQNAPLAAPQTPEDLPAIAPTVEIHDVSYETVKDLKRLKEWVASASLKGKLVVDTETTSLNTREAELVGIALCTESGKACYIPLAHKSKEQTTLPLGPTPPLSPLESSQLNLESVLALLKPILEDKSILKIFHNAKYDLAIFKKYTIDVAPIEDTMVLSYVLHGAQHRHNLDDLAQIYLQHETITYKSLMTNGVKNFAEVPIDKASTYAAEDADITWRLYERFKPQLAYERLLTIYERFDRPLINVLLKMEEAGIEINRIYLNSLNQEFDQKLKELSLEIYELAGVEFNIGSPKQLGEILFDRLGLEGGKKGKTGAYKTDVDVLESLTYLGHPLPKKILEWRQFAKLKSTYSEALLTQADAKTNRVHTSFSLTTTTTGRLASSSPNLQNIPVRTEEGRKIRAAFQAKVGHLLLSLDYSQIELRLLAHSAKIPSLLEAFHQGIDIHKLTASQVFGVSLEEVSPELRRQAKAINFGIIYGMSPFGLSQQLGISPGEAKVYMEAYFKQYPGIQAYMEEIKRFARTHGYVETLFGRRCPVPEIMHANQMRRSFAERQAINAPLQGTAADIIKRAMIHIDAALQKTVLKGRMILQVHDELLFEVPENEVEEMASLAKRLMESAAYLDVPLVAEVGQGKTWKEAHS